MLLHGHQLEHETETVQMKQRAVTQFRSVPQLRIYLLTLASTVLISLASAPAFQEQQEIDTVIMLNCLHFGITQSSDVWICRTRALPRKALLGDHLVVQLIQAG